MLAALVMVEVAVLTILLMVEARSLTVFVADDTASAAPDAVSVTVPVTVLTAPEIAPVISEKPKQLT